MWDINMSQSNKDLFIKAVSYIHQNIDDPALKLEDIAAEIGTSTSSLKRLFEEFIEQSPGSFIRRLRMELAFRSIKSKNQSILETALSFGFEDHSAFSRRFKETFGYPPVQGREKINIVHELECITLEEPDIVELETLEIQCVTKKGLYFECAPQAWAALSQKLNALELTDDFPGVFIGIGHDNPHEGSVTENQVRFSAGISLCNRDLGIEKITLAPGHYARFRYAGKIWNIGLAYHYIYGKWLESSSYEVNTACPAFLSFDRLPDGKNKEKIIIHVPLCLSDRSSLPQA